MAMMIVTPDGLRPVQPCEHGHDYRHWASFSNDGVDRWCIGGTFDGVPLNIEPVRRPPFDVHEIPKFVYPWGRCSCGETIRSSKHLDNHMKGRDCTMVECSDWHYCSDWDALPTVTVPERLLETYWWVDMLCEDSWTWIPNTRPIETPSFWTGTVHCSCTVFLRCELCGGPRVIEERDDEYDASHPYYDCGPTDEDLMEDHGPPSADGFTYADGTERLNGRTEQEYDAELYATYPGYI